MARVEISSMPWGVLQDRHGESQNGATATLKNLDGTNATTWSAVTGGSSSTASLTADSNGNLPRFIEGGQYTIDVPALGVSGRRVEAVSGLAESLRQPGNRVASLGDSITANGVLTTPASGYIYGKNWLAQAMLKSGGRIKWAGNYGTSGYTSTQILATWLPQVLAASPKPDYCTVLAGTNDNGASIALATTFANLASMALQLRGAGIEPILCLLTPRTTNSAIYKINRWIARHAEDNDYELVDFHTGLTDATTGNWTTGLSDDGLHPNEHGGDVMGTLLNAQLAPRLRQWGPVVPVDALDAGITISNPLIADSNADGLPDGWTVRNTDGTQTPTTVTDADFIGKAFDLTKSTGTGLSAYSTGGLTIASGDLIRIVYKVKVIALAAASVARVWLASSGANVAAFPELRLGYASNTVGTFVFEGRAASAFTFPDLRIGIEGGTGQIRVGQIGVTNFTALGLDV